MISVSTGEKLCVSVDTLAKPSRGMDAARSTEAKGYFSDQSIEAAKRSLALGKTIPDRHHAGPSVIAPGRSRPLARLSQTERGLGS